jgi:Flp pilus assembly CpaE family ATPase
MLNSLQSAWQGSLALVVNQASPEHPANAGAVAEAMDLQLLGILPMDRRAIGYQIHFGKTAIHSKRSSYGRAIRSMANRLERFKGIPPPPSTDL